MSVSTLLSVGARALQANYAALQTTGHNIANANTDGYSRQQVELATTQGQFTGGGFFGRGVDVATVTRSHDQFLTREAATSKSVAASDAARLAQMERLEQVFDMGEAGIGHVAGQLLNAFTDVASRPQDISARQVVLSRAEEVASRFRSAHAQLTELQASVSQEMKNSVVAVNALARQVARINEQIAAVQGSGHTPNDLLDERDRLISQINDYIQVTTVNADDGTTSLFIGGGQRLVLGSTAQQLQTRVDLYDPEQLHVWVSEGSTTRALPDDSLGGGSIAGLLRFQSADLTDARNLLGQIASALASRLNQQQSFGLDLRQPAGSGAPILAVGAARVLPASTNAASTVGITVMDATLLQASNYDLRPDPGGAAGMYQLTRLSDGLVRTVAAGAVVDGFRIDIGVPVPAAGNSYLLQPVAQATASMQRVLDDPRGIAAASPFTAQVGAANTGTASIDTLRVASSSFNANLNANITFTSNNGNYNWELRNATTNALVSSGSATWTAGQPIVLNGWELALNGVPMNVDTLTVNKTAFPSGNNGNAIALLGLRDETLVGRELVAGLPALGATVTTAYASAMADIGVRVQSARFAADFSHTVSLEAEAARTSRAGVNLDEEAARLIQFQQSYQAAAKVLTVAQSIFDTLLDVTSPR